MIIIDNFLPQGEFLESITDESRWEKSLPYSWKDNDTRVHSKNIWEDLATIVWRDVAKIDVKYDGFEYWTNPLTAGGRDDLPWHYDKDELHYEKTGEVVTPYRGMVYYAHKELPTGGYLEVERPNGEVERIEPQPNRLIVFDPSIIHRVLPITSGVRRTFACNCWVNKPLEENFGQSYDT
jgi:hypothetical protein